MFKGEYKQSRLTWQFGQRPSPEGILAFAHKGTKYTKVFCENIQVWAKDKLFERNSNDKYLNTLNNSERYEESLTTLVLNNALGDNSTDTYTNWVLI